MNRLIRFYNQNRLQFWITVLMIAGIILLIHIINGFIVEDNARKASQVNNTVKESKEERLINQKASNPIIDGNNLSKEQREINKNIIDNFFQYCKNGEDEQAYNLLTENCKELFFNTLQDFRVNYINKIISSNMKYDYELWNSSRYNVYRIKIYEDMLSTGKVSNSYKEDYFTIVNEKSQTKLNINSFISRVYRNSNVTKNNVTIKVNYIDIYKDTLIYNLTVSNNSSKNIILDTRKNTNSTYLENSYGVKTPALLYENYEKDLMCGVKQENTLNIKFNITYRGDLSIEKLVFSDVILDSNNTSISEEFKIEL